jgi:hypothetical protein
MRVLRLAVAGMLALIAPITGHAVPLAPSMEQLAPAPGIIPVRGGCGPGWRLVPGHRSEWRGEWVPPHSAPDLITGGVPYSG